MDLTLYFSVSANLQHISKRVFLQFSFSDLVFSRRNFEVKREEYINYLLIYLSLSVIVCYATF